MDPVFRIVFICLLFFSSMAKAQEICNNGIDDDANGLIDLNDPQCTCNESLLGNPVSLIPNPSFEDTTSCPVGLGSLISATSWQAGTWASTDYFNCNFFPSGIVNAGLTPFPDGTGAVGMLMLSDYREYAGCCLITPLAFGNSYLLKMDVAMLDVDPNLLPCPLAQTDWPPFALTIYGAPTCGNLPWGTLGGAPNGPFIPIDSILYDPQASWQTILIPFTPDFNVAEIIIGASPSSPSSVYPDALASCYPYFLMDNLILNTTSAFNDPFQLILSGDLCDENAVLAVSSVLPGGNWQWYKDGIAITGQTNPSLTLSDLGLGGGNYTVVCNIGGNCASSSLVVADAEPFSISVNSDTICYGESVVLIATDNAPVYNWSPATGLNMTNGPLVIASPETTTNYTVTASANGCTASAVATVTVDHVNMSISASPNPATTDYPFVQFDGEPSGEQLDWNFGDNETYSGASVLHQFPDIEGSYNVQLIAHTSQGCVDTLLLIVFIQSDLTVYVPNSFTPNGDPFNAVFIPVFSGKHIENSYELKIYDRWGEVVFKTGNRSESWDGTMNGQVVPDGEYTWKIQIKENEMGDYLKFVGHVNLIR